MKNLIIILSMLLGYAYGQTPITYTPMTAAGYQFKYGKFDSLLHVPFGDTAIKRGATRPGALMCYTGDSLIYRWDGLKWAVIAPATASTVTYGVDSITYSNNLLCQWKTGISTCYTVIGGGGVDSVTLVGSNLCQWKNGVPTCYTITGNVLGSFVDSVVVSGNQLCQWVTGVSTCYTINNTNNGIDSVTFYGNQLCQWKGGIPTCYVIPGSISATGLDSITLHGDTLCQWVDGAATCYPFGQYFKDASMNYDSSLMLFYDRSGNLLDSVDLYYKVLLTRSGVVQKDTTVTINGKVKQGVVLYADPSAIVPTTVVEGDITWQIVDSLNTPSLSAIDGEFYLVGDNPTGGGNPFVGHSKDIAEVNSPSYIFHDADTGNIVYNLSTDIKSEFNGVTWVWKGNIPLIAGGNSKPNALIRIGNKNNQGVSLVTNNAIRATVSSSGVFTFIPQIGTGTRVATLSSTGALGNIANTTNGFVLTLTGGVPVWATSAVPNLQAVSDVGNVTTRSLYMDSVIATSDGKIHGLTVGRGNASGVTTNTVVGSLAGSQLNNTSGAFGTLTTLIGFEAGDSLTTGFQNVAIGSSALHSAKTIAGTTVIGRDAMKFALTGNSNTVIGASAMGTGINTGAQNVAIGSSSMNQNTSGNANVGVGSSSLAGNTTGVSNTAIGFAAMSSNTTSRDNVAIGSSALTADTTGSKNVAIGSQSAPSIRTGTGNVIIGYQSGNRVTGHYNNAYGDSALFNTTSGLYNVGVGYAAITRTVTGNNAIAIGTNAIADPYQLAFSDSTTGMYFKNLDSATGTAPAVVGKSGDGKWHVYATPSGGGGGGTGTVTSIATTSPITGGTITSTGTIGINNAAADGSTKGAASFTANDFDATSGNISLDYTNGQAASGSNKGFLTSADWTTFNGKQAAINGTGFVKATGTTISYDNSTYLTQTTGDARYGLLTNRIDQNNAATTSAQLLSAISDESGTGVLLTANGSGSSLTGVGLLASANDFTANGALSLPAFKISGTPITGGSTTTNKPLFLIEETGVASSTNWSALGTYAGVNALTGFTGNLLDLKLSGSNRLSVSSAGTLTLPTGSLTITAGNETITAGNLTMTAKQILYGATMTAGGTTGNQTINKPSGSVNIAAAGTTVTVTNSLVTTASIVTASVMTADATAYIKNIVSGAGQFIITLGAAATAETKIGFIVAN